MKNDVIEWFYSIVRNFVQTYVDNIDRDFTKDKIDQIIRRIPDIIENFKDPTTEEEYNMLAKKSNGTLATIQIVDRSTGYKVYKTMTTEEYKNFYYELLMYALIDYELFFQGWKYEIVDEEGINRIPLEFNEEQLPHMLGIEAKYMGDCALLDKIIGNYSGKRPIEQILLIIENYEKIKAYEGEHNVEIFNYYKSMQKVKEFLLLGRMFNEYRESRPEQNSLIIVNNDGSTNQKWLYKKSNMNSTMNRSIIKILIQLSDEGKYFPRSVQSITEDIEAVQAARRELVTGGCVLSDIPEDIRGILLSKRLITIDPLITKSYGVKLNKNESLINPFAFMYGQFSASYISCDELQSFISMLNETLPEERQIKFEKEPTIKI